MISRMNDLLISLFSGVVNMKILKCGNLISSWFSVLFDTMAWLTSTDPGFCSVVVQAKHDQDGTVDAEGFY